MTLDHKLTLRVATEHDAAELAAVHNDIIREEYDTVYSPEALAAWASHDEASWRAILCAQVHTILVALVDDHIIGAAGLNITQQRLSVYVLPIWHKQGIGRRLMQTAFDIARAKGIVKLMISAPAAAVPFYLRHGYAIVAEHLHVYDNGATMPVFDLEMTL